MTRKNVSELTASYVKKLETEKSKTVSRQDANLASFLALKAEITEALNKGYSMKIIWETLHFEEKLIGFGYDQFRRYIKKHSSLNKQQQQEQNKINKPKPNEFIFNKTPNPDDLY